MLIEPVEITIQADHLFKDRGKNKSGCGAVLPNGTTCMKAAHHRSHLGIPLSLNQVGSRGGHYTYRTFKSAWEEVLCEALEASGLPAGWREGSTLPKINLINVEGVVCFGERPHLGRDQGNFRWFLEKCLGDALSKGYSYSTGSKKKGDYERHVVNPGGWIEDDTIYPVRHFDFGNTDIIYRPGEFWSRMTLFPS